MRFSSIFCCLFCWKKKKLTDLAILKKDKEEKKLNKVPLFNKKSYNDKLFNMKDNSISMSYINKYEVRNRNSVLYEENNKSLSDLKEPLEKISPKISPQPKRHLKRDIQLENIIISNGEDQLENVSNGKNQFENIIISNDENQEDLSIGSTPTETSSSKSEDLHSQNSSDSKIDMSQSVLEDVVNTIYNQPHPSQSILQLRNFIDDDLKKTNLEDIDSSTDYSSSDEDAPMEEIRLSSPITEINKYERDRRQSSISQADKIELEQEGYDIMSDLDSPFNEK